MLRPLSNRLDDVAPSATLAATSRANDLKARGVRVYPFGAGEPDFPVNGAAKLASIEAVLKNLSGYTSVTGLPSLREAISRKILEDYGVSYDPSSEVIVSSGAKHSLYTAMMALCSPGEEIIIPAPSWVSYFEMARLAGCVPVSVSAGSEDGYILSPDALRAAVTAKTKALVLNNPSNPTGVVYTASQLASLAQVCLEEGIYIIIDEIYDKFLYDGAVHVCMPSLGREVRDICVLVNGFSKTYAMPGWRVGYSCAPAPVVAAMSAIQGHCVSHPSTVSMYAAEAALRIPEHEIRLMLDEYAARRLEMEKGLAAAPGVSFARPSGAFYFFVDVRPLLGSSLDGRIISDDAALALALIEEAHVVTVQGSAFGAGGFLRFSYACGIDDIREGTGVFAEFCGRLAR